MLPEVIQLEISVFYLQCCQKHFKKLIKLANCKIIEERTTKKLQRRTANNILFRVDAEEIMQQMDCNLRIQQKNSTELSQIIIFLSRKKTGKVFGE